MLLVITYKEIVPKNENGAAMEPLDYKKWFPGADVIPQMWIIKVFI